MNFWDAAIAVIGGVVLIYAVLLVLLALYARKHPETVGMKDAPRLLPDLLTLLRRLTVDRTLPRGIRVRLILLLIYSPHPLTWSRISFLSSGTPTMSSSWHWSCARSSAKGATLPWNGTGPEPRPASP